MTKQVKGIIIKVNYPLQDNKQYIPLEKQYLQMDIYDDNLPSSPSMYVRQKIHNLYVNLMPPTTDTILLNIGLINSITLTNIHQENYNIEVSILLIKQK